MRLAVLVLLLVLCIRDSASQAPSDAGVRIPGMASCGDWYSARRGEGKYSWQADISWFQGFISAHNLYARNPTNRQILAEPNDVALWVDTYCQKNPTQTVVHAASAYAVAHGGQPAFPQPAFREQSIAPASK
jgi:hypothetical protein